MTPGTGYIITSLIYMAVFYLFYLVILSSDTLYSRNRFYLLASLVASLLLPLIHVDINPSDTLSSIHKGVTSVITIDQVNVIQSQQEQSGSYFHTLLLLIYLSGAVAMLASTVIFCIRIFRVSTEAGSGSNKIIYSDFNSIAGFSAFGHIYISTHLDKQEAIKIAEHEEQHIRHRHFYDLVFLRILTIIFWFNPFIYLFNRSLKAVHEYQADKNMLDRGENPVSYTRLLLGQVFRTGMFSFHNPFASKTLLKKRIIMMTKKQTKSITGFKVLLLTPFIIFIFLLFSCSQEEISDDIKILPENTEPEKVELKTEVKEKATDDPVFIVVEEMPLFRGGDVNTFRDWVQKNVKYPAIAASNGIQGKVFVTFTVDTDGSVYDASILKGVDPSLDQEVLRVVNSSPEWSPGKQSGKTVKVKFSITVNFMLN